MLPVRPNLETEPWLPVGGLEVRWASQRRSRAHPRVAYRSSIDGIDDRERLRTQYGAAQRIS
jgi:hypothetical protein